MHADPVADRIQGLNLAALFRMRSRALAPRALANDLEGVREDTLTAALYAARARRDALAAEVEQVRTRARLHGAYVEGTRGDKGALSTTAAEQAAGRDPEYLTAKERAAELAEAATAAEAIARDMAHVLATALPAGHRTPTFTVQVG